MANNRDDDLTISIGGIAVKGRVSTDLNTGTSRWYPYDGPNYDLSSNIYLESKKGADGTFSGWIGSGNIFNELRYRNPQLASAYSTKEKLASAFYSSAAPGSPTDNLNKGRLNQFNTYGAPQTAKTLGIPGTVNAAPKNEEAKKDEQAEPLKPINDISISIPDSEASVKIDDTLKVNLRYPLQIDSNDQDRIKFSVRQIIGRKNINIADVNKFSLGTRELSAPLGTVVLPIQPSITDSNGVDWGGTSLNPLQAYAASASLQMIDAPAGITGAAAEALRSAAVEFKKGFTEEGYQKAIALYFAQEAVGAQNLLSRTSGAVLNPNLELLFNGPTLRPFNFTFKLSPRNKPEAEQVKKIINFFKKAMAVKTAASEVFLKAPNVFNIEYLKGTKTHDSLNKIKTCALLGFEVDYAPDGTYMTYEDGTMTSYQISLRFSELDPIYSKDYEGTHSIGY